MQKSELLTALQEHLAQLGKYQSFIDKAREASGKFSAAVVEKVVSENSHKIAELLAEAQPLLPQAAQMRAGLRDERDDIEAGVAEAKLKLEELDLRLMIGEIDEDTHKSEGKEARKAESSASKRMLEIDADVEALTEAISAWDAYLPTATASKERAPEKEEELLGSLDDEDEPLLGGEEDDAFADDDDAFADGNDHSADSSATLANDMIRIIDDVSSVFEAAPAESEEELVLGDDVDGAPAHAELIRDEGQSGEQRYAVTSEVVSIGRNRDNTIRINSDSKVSRYHARIFLRDGYYFVEDIKSANGTLVNNQLITEKRLLGGEEIIVGETLFRFVIHNA